MENGTKLQRALGMREAITITIGTVVGVGIFTVGAQCTGILTGGGIILATFIAMLTCIFPALMYAEMGAALPYAGGTYNYAKRAINKPVASIAAWHYIIAIISTCASEALAFANYFSWIFKGAGIQLNVDVRIFAAVLMFFFIFINFRGIELSGKIQNGFVFFFWIASAIWMLYMIRHAQFTNFLPSNLTALPGFKDFVSVVTWIWWCFAGFETAVGMGGEIKYPQINIPRAMTLCPFIIFVVNALFQWFLTALVPLNMQSALATAAAPYAEGLEMAGYVGLPIILLCLAISMGGDMSTMNPGVAAPARYIYQMGADGVLPKVFGKLHPKYNTPYVAVIFIGVFAFLLILTNSILFVAALSVCSLFWVYIIGFVAFWRLRKKEPNLNRPYKVPFAPAATISSIAAYVIMLWSCGWNSILLSCSITAASLIFYVFFGRKYSVSHEELVAVMEAEAAILQEDIPSQKEIKKMDKEYKIWKIGVIGAFAFTLILYLISFLTQ